MNGSDKVNLRRKIYDEMLEWKKEQSRHKALVIEGLRQIGKTYIVEKFVESEYKDIYYFDFRKNEEHRNAFKSSFNLNEFKMIIVSLFNKEYDDKDAVLVFDEIGDCADARAAIKYILKDTNFDIIATGSLLGVKGFSTRTNRSPSVGSEHFINMYPLDFEEFLWANGISEEMINEIRNSLSDFHKINDFFHNTFNNLFKSYIAVGGMPEAVIKFLETKDYYKAYETNLDKLKELEGDFGRTLDENGKIIIDSTLLVKTREVYETIPSQLAKDNTKFQYSYIKKGARAYQYDEAIRWLEDSGMVAKCCNLSDIGSPLSMNKINDNYKLYVSDNGLLLSKIGFQAISSLLRDDLSSVGGFIYENVAADALVKADYDLFFSNNGVSELDFVIDTINGPAILEVKMGNHNSKSARAVITGKSNRHASICYKVRSGNFGVGDYYYGLPHYALSFLLEILKKEIIDSLK